MDTKYRLLQFDYWIQRVLGIAILICCVTVIGFWVGILGLMPLGAAQVLSGLVFAIGYQDRKRWVYLLIVSVFFLCWYGVTEVSYDSKFYQATQIFSVLLFFIPPSLAVWYFGLTAEEYKDMKVQHDFKTFTEEQVLDA